MSRATLGFNYADAPSRGDGIDRGPDWSADEPEHGYYRTRRRGGVWRPIAIWYGPPLDPQDGYELDRMWRWNCLFCGRTIYDLTLVWPGCKAQRIDQAEYDYLIARMEHARQHDPRDPHGRPAGTVDWLTSTPPTF